MKERNIPVSIAVGAVVCMIVSVLASLGIAALMIEDKLNESNMVYAVYATQLLSILSGIAIAVKSGEEKRTLKSILIAVIYGFVLLCVNVLVYDSDFAHIPLSAIMILAGWLCGILIKNRRVGNKHTKRRRSR